MAINHEAIGLNKGLRMLDASPFILKYYGPYTSITEAIQALLEAQSYFGILHAGYKVGLGTFTTVAGQRVCNSISLEYIYIGGEINEQNLVPLILDKSKLDGIAAGAEVNQNAFSNVKVGTTTVVADSKTDTLTLAAGNNITITPDATNDMLTIAATDTTYNNATTSVAGLMSAEDKAIVDLFITVLESGGWNVDSNFLPGGTSISLNNTVIPEGLEERLTRIEAILQGLYGNTSADDLKFVVSDDGNSNN